MSTLSDSRLTTGDVSEIAARYVLSYAPGAAALCHRHIEDFTPQDASAGFGLVASEALGGFISLAKENKVDPESAAMILMDFAVHATVATLTEPPPVALETISRLYDATEQSLMGLS